MAYDKALDYYYIAETVRHDDYVMGMKKGLEEGREEGLKKGIKEGIEKGRKEGLA